MRDIFRFCFFSLIFLLIFSVVYLAKYYKDAKDGDYQYSLPGSEVYKAIRKSKQKSSKKKVVIGDSTGNQFFSVSNDGDCIYSLACNQAISMCGHYLLLDNCLKSGTRPNQVFLVLNVFSFGNNLDQKYSFHYFLKPFYNSEYKTRMSETVSEQIKKIPYHKWSQFPRFLTTMWSPDYRPKQEFQLMSPISNEYLLKIDSLQSVYDFDLYLIPSIISESKREIIKRLSVEKMCEVNKRLQSCLTTFMNSIIYVNDTCFMDEKHLKNPELYRYLIEEEMGDDSFLLKIN